MISGSIDTNDLPVVVLRLRGPYGSTSIETIVDTAFGGNLTIPTHIVQLLGLPRAGVAFNQDARGVVSIATTRDCQIHWHGRWEDLEAVESQIGVSLAGARLLHGRKLTIDYGPARAVEIE